METDHISRSEFNRTMQERYCFNCERKGNHPIFGVACKACWVLDMLDEVEQFQSADVRHVVKCLECENALRDDSNKVVHCDKNGEHGYVWCKKEGCCRSENFFCANGEKRYDNGD